MDALLAPFISLGQILFLVLCAIAALWVCMQLWVKTERVHGLLALWVVLAIASISLFAFFGSLLNIPLFGAGVGIVVFIGIAAYTGSSHFDKKS